MAELRAMCNDLGFENVRTYIASGNVVLTSPDSGDAVRRTLEDRLREFAGKDVGVVVRTAAEIRSVLEANPFPDANPSQTLATLLNDPPAGDALEQAAGINNEECRLGDREIYVHFPDGMGRSKLRIPAAKDGTARNMNTIRKMIELAEALNAS